jgi:hypothetical protein
MASDVMLLAVFLETGSVMDSSTVKMLQTRKTVLTALMMSITVDLEYVFERKIFATESKIVLTEGMRDNVYD